jgi:hypothetical protein
MDTDISITIFLLSYFILFLYLHKLYITSVQHIVIVIGLIALLLLHYNIKNYIQVMDNVVFHSKVLYYVNIIVQFIDQDYKKSNVRKFIKKFLN